MSAMRNGKSAWCATVDRRPELPTISDAPNGDSTLFDRNADAVVRIIEGSTLEHGFTIGVFGPWGSGKTSFLKRVESKIQKENANKNDEGILNFCIDFDAWRFNDRSQVTSALYQTIAISLDDTSTNASIDAGQEKDSEPTKNAAPHNNSLSRKAKKAGTKIAPILKMLGILADISLAAVPGMPGLAASLLSAVPDLVDKTCDLRGMKRDFNESQGGASPENAIPKDKVNQLSAATAYYPLLMKKLSKTLQAEKLRIIVFVDDLDRCAPETVGSLIQGIGSCMDVNNIVFVLALDRDYLVNVINRQYGISQASSARIENEMRPTGASGILPARVDEDAFETSFGERFLEKIIQFPVYVPSIRFSDDEAQLKEVVGPDVMQQLKKYGVGEDEVEELRTIIIPYALRSNPRQVKRYLASFFYGCYVNWNEFSHENDADTIRKYMYMLGMKQAYFELYEGIRKEINARRGMEKDEECSLANLSAVVKIITGGKNDGKKQDEGEQNNKGSIYNYSYKSIFANYFCDVVGTTRDFESLLEFVSSSSSSEGEVEPVSKRYFQGILPELDEESPLKITIDVVTSYLVDLGARVDDSRPTGRWFEFEDSGKPVTVVTMSATSKSAKKIQLFVEPRSDYGKELLAENGSRVAGLTIREVGGHATGFGKARIDVPIATQYAIPPVLEKLLQAEVEAAK